MKNLNIYEGIKSSVSQQLKCCAFYFFILYFEKIVKMQRNHLNLKLNFPSSYLKWLISENNTQEKVQNQIRNVNKLWWRTQEIKNRIYRKTKNFSMHIKPFLLSSSGVTCYGGDEDDFEFLLGGILESRG